jgi:hypothetical protein
MDEFPGPRRGLRYKRFLCLIVNDHGR